MNFSNIQKAIGGFLLLAALTSSSVFLLTTNLPAPVTGSKSSAESLSLGGKNVFVEQVPGVDDFTSPFASKSDIAQGFAGKNITDYFTDSLTKELMASNLNGPSVANGVATLKVPKNFDQLADISGVTPGSFTAVVDQNRLKVVQKYTADDILTYLSEVKTSVDGTLKPGLAFLHSSTANQDATALAMDTYSRTEGAIYQTKVPAPLTGFNSALLGYIAAQKIFFDQSDPVKSLVALQNPQAVMAPYQARLLLEASKLQKNIPAILAAAAPKERSRIAEAFMGAFGINKAYALADIIGGIAGIIEAVLSAIMEVWDALMAALDEMEWLRKLLTEELKDQLIHKLMAQITNWVQGGGTPQFVSNWKGFLGDAANYAASGVINQIAPTLCSNFGPLVKLSLNPNPNVKVDYASPNSPYACTLDKALSSVNATIDQFTNDFSKGGWAAYGSILQPQNNLYGNLVIASDLATQEAAKAKTAAQADAASGGGFKSQKDCAESADEDIDPESVTSLRQDTDFLACNTTNASGLCTNWKYCVDWKNTTPGGLVANATNQISESPVGRIVNAQDITALLTALVNSALNKLIASGKKGLTSLTQTQLASAGSLADTCKGLATSTPPTGGKSDYQTCVDSNKGITDTNSDPAGTSKDQVLTMLKKSISMTTTDQKAQESLINATYSAIGYLQYASDTCVTGVIPTASTTPDFLKVMSFVTDNLDQYNGLPSQQAQASTTLYEINTNPGRMNLYTKLQDAVTKNDFVTMDSIMKLGPPIPSASSSASDQDDYYRRMLTAMNSAQSIYGQKLKTLDDIGSETQTAQIAMPNITLGDSGGCAILEKAKYLTSGDAQPVCNMAAVVKYCRP